MLAPYDPERIETKWQKYWLDNKAFKAGEDRSKPKFYSLIEFPYPSGQGLHVGHPRPYTALDIVARKRRMEGYNVLHCIGWDAFGLPTENYAIKNHIHPAKVTHDNIEHFRKQIQRLGFSFDYDREVNTTDPEYYRWTQWIFLQMFKRGLAYKTEMPINWCTSCKCVLANEEVVDGVCERCGSPVIHKVKNQWMLRITAYAQKLLDGLDEVDYIDRVKVQQRNWIGRSEGAEVDFSLKGHDEKIRVYTTRPDTLFGATYMVLSPEHDLIKRLESSISNIDEVRAYQAEAARKSDFERTEMNKDKTGVPLRGIEAINPVTGNAIPVWISDYVLTTYGTGAIMAVPAHDDRDWDFAKKFGLPIIEVVAGSPDGVENAAYTDVEEGTLVNSGFLNGLSVAEAKKAIIAFLEEKGLGVKKVNYKLRDWVFARQRYWGEPIPIVHCPHCGMVPLDEKDLPLRLPDVEHYEPTDDGESPLSRITDWVNVPCPRCGAPAKRETDTMPQWAGSSWYFLRYCDPNNHEALAGMDALKYWMPVDWYNGGMEHTTLHLLYSRFWNQFLYDIGAVSTMEPYRKRTSHGMVLGENGEKMSKSRGNVVNPDDMIAEIGADALRMYEMFMGAFDQAIPWSNNGARGCRKFLDRVWRLQENILDGDSYRDEMKVLMNQSIKKVSEDYERMKFNTAIAQMMTLVNEFYQKGVNRAEFKTLLLLLDPVAPHICEEIWQNIGEKEPVYKQAWPKWDENYLNDDTVEIAVQINGKIKCKLVVPRAMTREEGTQVLPGKEEVQPFLEGKSVVKAIYVPGRLLNLVVK